MNTSDEKPDGRIHHYLDEQGRVVRFPVSKKNRKDQTIILEYLAEKFEIGKVYTERDVNELLKQWHTFGDWALLRRELFERGYINRKADCSEYWRTSNTKLY
ncbi:MAG: hypothetical protein CUN52_01995 [Phototrophicales bacterium]|nr:MAG: hypothetical protein CUN52_01995 [Phototrophicales bacterium]